MLLIPRYSDPLDHLAKRIELAAAPSRDLIDEIIATACTRFCSLKAAGKTGQFDEWCRSGAWVDAASELASLELPAWSIRRIVRDYGLWLCTLSRMPNLPADLDDVVEVSHENLPLAILAAFVEAKRSASNATPATKPWPSTSPTERHQMCCDNFS